MNKIFKALTLVLIMTLCIGAIFAFVGCDEDKPIDELEAIDVVIGNGEDLLILSVDNANIEAIKEAIKVTALFSDNDIAEIIDEYEIIGFDPNVEGEQSVTIRYMDFEAIIKVSVQENPVVPTLESIRVNLEKLTIDKEDANLDTIKSKIIVYAVYSDESENAITDYTIEGFDADANGEQTVSVKYLTFSTTINVTIERPVEPDPVVPTLESIRVNLEKLTIDKEDANLDTIKTRIIVYAVYSDESENAITDYTIEGELDLDSTEDQTLTISYQGKTTTLVVLITERQVPVEPIKYYVYLNDNATEMVENEETDKTDGRFAEYSAVIALSVNDSIVIKDSLGNTYANYQDCDFDGTAKIDGNYTVYLKLYADGHAIYVAIPQGGSPEIVKMYINSDTEGRVLEEYPSSDENVTVQYFIKVELEEGDLVIFKAGNVEYDAYEDGTSFDGVVSIDGEYEFYVKFYKDEGHSIWVKKPVPIDPTPSPETFTVYFYNYANWTNVNAYVWSGSGLDAIYPTAWPGETMTAVDGHENWYKLEISGDYESLVFNAGDNLPQTLNLTIDKENLYYNGYEWTNGFNIYEGILSRTIYYYNKFNWEKVNAYAWTESGYNKIENANWSGVEMTSVEGHEGWFSIEIGIEYKEIIFNYGTNQTENLVINDEDGLYYYNDGWLKEFGELVDPTPVITENSVVKLVVGETETLLVINENSNGGVLEFMIAKIEFEANTTFKITVDGQEYNNYKEESPIKGSITGKGSYCIYVSNNGIYAATYTAPTPTVPTLTENSIVKLYIQKGVETLEHTLTKNDSSLSGAIEYMITNVSLTANDIITIKIGDVEITNYKNDLVKDGHVSEDGNYNFYVSDEGIHVEKAEIVPIEPTLESIRVNLEKLTIDKEDANLDTIKTRIIVYAVYSDESENAITDYTTEGELDLDSTEDQTLTICYQGKTTTLVVLITERQVPVEPIKYYVYLNDNATEMVENEETDKTDGRFAEYSATVDLGIGDTITIKDSLGKSYESFENFSGTAVWTGTHTVYLKLYSDGNSIWVSTPQVNLTAESVVKLIIDNDIKTLSRNENNTDRIEYKIENVAITTENVIKVLVHDIETANYKNTLVVNRKISESGNYNFFVADDGIHVEKAEIVPVDPDPVVPTVPTLTENSVVKLYIQKGVEALEHTLTKNDSSLSGAIEYMITNVSLTANDIITIKIDDVEITNYKNDLVKEGHVSEDGNYNFYVSDEGIHVEKAEIVPVDPDPVVPTVPTLTENSVVKLVVGETETLLVINENSNGGVLEFMIAKIEFEANTTFKITVDGQEYNNYKEESPIKGSITGEGSYCIYVSNNGIYAATYTEPTPYSVSIIVNNDAPIVMTESQSDDANVTAQYTITITLKKDDVVKIIDSTDFVFINYELTTSFNGTATVDGEYTFYAKKYVDGGDSIWVAVPTSEDTDPDIPVAPDTVTIYYYNLKNWNDVNAYAWLNNDKNESWPGEAMTAVDGHDNWYSIEISASFTSIIFNEGLDKEQTRDITIVANKYYFNGYEWTDGFNTQEKRILYFKNTGSWNAVNAYSWNDSKNNAVWPGQAMTAVEGHEGWYMIELSADYNMVIFNNGSVQTSNINYYVGCTYYDYSLGKWVESF